ncbi:hypothetical protein pb186bvf_000580 [Paramecium bursaria]
MNMINILSLENRFQCVVARDQSNEKSDSLEDDKQKYIKEITDQIQSRNISLQKMEIVLYVMGCQKSGKSLLTQAILNKLLPNYNQDSQEILEYIELAADFEVLEPSQNKNPIYFQKSDFLNNLKLQGDKQFKVAEYPGFILNNIDHNIRILKNFQAQTQNKNQISLLLWVINSNNGAKEEKLRQTLLSHLNFEKLSRYSIQNFQPINSINTVFEEGIKDIVVYTQCDKIQLTLESLSEEQKYFVSALAYLKQRKQFTSQNEQQILKQYNYQEQELNYYYKQQLQLLKNEIIDAIEYQYDLMIYGSNYLRIYSKIVMLDQLVEGKQTKILKETAQKIIFIYDKITNKKNKFEIEVQYLISEQKKKLNRQLQLSYLCLEELQDVNQIITSFYEEVYQDFLEKYLDTKKTYQQNIEDAKNDIYQIFGGLEDFKSIELLIEQNYVPMVDQFACQLEKQLQIFVNEDNFLKIIQSIKESITNGILENQGEFQLMFSLSNMNLGIQQIIKKLNQMAYKIRAKENNQNVIKKLLQQNKKMLETLFVRVCQRFIVSMNYFHSFYKIFFSELDIQF